MGFGRECEDVWFRDPQNARVVDGPGSSTSQPCGKRDVLDLAVASADPAQTYVARLDAPKCPGVAIVLVGQSDATSCVRSPAPKDSGQIAMSLVKGGGWLVVGDTTMRSTDNLATWSASWG